MPSERQWRVVIVHADGKRHRVGGGISGRGQGTPFVSERAAREIADDTERAIAEDAIDRGVAVTRHCEVEEFDYYRQPEGRPRHLPRRYNMKRLRTK